MDRSMRAGNVAAAIGKGLVAGFVGTLAITASQMLEMKLRHRPPSTAPADAAGKALGVQPKSETDKQRFAKLVHFGYGTLWGAFRGLLDALGVDRKAAAALELGAVEGTAMVMLPGLKVAPPVSQWSAEEIAIETGHHVVYVAALEAAFEFLNRHSRTRRSTEAA